MISISSMGVGEIKAPWKETTDVVDVNWSVDFFIEVKGVPVDFCSLPQKYKEHILNYIRKEEETSGFFIVNEHN